MRSALAVGAPLLFLLLAVQSVVADAHETRVTDPAGDVRSDLLVTQSPVAYPAQTMDHLDILGVWIANETQETLEVGVRLRRWDTPGASPLPFQRFVDIMFSRGHLNYTIMYPANMCEANEARIQAGRFFNYDYRLPYRCHAVTVDAAQGSLKLNLDKSLLFDQEYAPLQLAGQITNLHAETGSRLFGGDQAPDVLPGPGFVSRIGDPQGGDIFLTADHPLRASNGEATTILYKLKLSNVGQTERSVLITVDNANAEWDVRTPNRVRVPARTDIMVPVILSMNFSHEHGTTRFIEVRAEAHDDVRHFATARLGVHWLEIPQPAGHHDKLWLHAERQGAPIFGTPLTMGDLGYTNGWMNALERDPRAASDAEMSVNTAALNEARWLLYLSPDLQIGLDIDPSRPASFDGAIRPNLPATRAVLNATVAFCDRSATSTSLQLCEEGRQLDLAWGQVQLGALSANVEHRVSLPLIVNPSVDQLSFVPGARLLLGVTLRADTPQRMYLDQTPLDAKLVTRGSTLQLPLLEYHDAIDQSFERIGSLRLTPLDAHEKLVNPGRTAAFRFDLTNTGTVPQRLGLSVEGINHEWAQVRGGNELELRPDEKRQVTLFVRAPDEAVAGERAELFLIAENLEDPTISAISRVRASVVDVATADVTDEATILDTDERRGGTPGPQMLAIVAALAWGAAWRRRQRLVP